MGGRESAYSAHETFFNISMTFNVVQTAERVYVISCDVK